MNKNRGQAITWVLIVLAVLLVGGGAYYYGTHKLIPVQNVENSNISTNTSTPGTTAPTINYAKNIQVGNNPNSLFDISKYPSIDVLKNANYYLSDGTIHKLTNGRYDFSFLQGKDTAATQTNGYAVLDLNNIGYADLSDHFENFYATIAVVHENTGGNGDSAILEVLGGKEAIPYYSYQLGDRVDIHSISVYPPPTQNSKAGWYIAVDFTPWDGGSGVRKTIKLIPVADGGLDVLQ